MDFPKIVYMVVDKKIELEIKLLKDFPEWEFLPHDDLRQDTNKNKVDLLIDETIELPISFIVGTSFILGSIFGNLIVLDMKNE